MTTAYCMPINDLSPFLNPFNPIKSFFNDNRGMSPEANIVAGKISDIYDDSIQSITFIEQLEEIYNYFSDISEECSANNWDGYGAKAFDINSFIIAANFIASLPSIFQKPEINVDPDGEIALEWFNGPKRMFSVSFGKKGVLSYAGLFGINRTHGTEYFENELPQTILENIKRVFS